MVELRGFELHNFENEEKYNKTKVVNDII